VWVFHNVKWKGKVSILTCHHIKKTRVIIHWKQMINTKSIKTQYPKKVRATSQTTKRRSSPLGKVGKNI